MSKSLWWTLGGGLTVLVVLAGTLATWLWISRSAEHVEHQETVDARPVTRVVFADIEAGDIRIDAAPAGTTGVTIRRTLHWNNDKPTSVERWDGQTLRISSHCDNLVRITSTCSIDYALQVPAGVAVEATVVSGDIRVQDVTGDIRLTTTSGDLRVVNPIGALALHTTSGDITGTGVGSATAELASTSGQLSLRFTTAPRTVDVQAVSGDIAISVPRDTGAYRVEAETDSGDRSIQVDRADRAERRIAARTTSGDVTVSYA